MLQELERCFARTSFVRYSLIKSSNFSASYILDRLQSSEDVSCICRIESLPCGKYSLYLIMRSSKCSVSRIRDIEDLELVASQINLLGIQLVNTQKETL